MKNRRVTFRIVTLFTVLGCLLMSFSSCGLLKALSDEYPFIHETENISSVEIVSLKYNYTEADEVLICKIENIEDFLDDFVELKSHTKSPPNGHPDPTTTAIKISYRNDDYEIITSNGTIANRSDSKIYYGSRYFDDADFFELLAKYIDSAEIQLEYNFLDRETEIKSIEIVKIGEYTEYDYIPEHQDVISQIEDHATFLDEFSQVDCFLNKNLPTRVRCNAKMIKITYNSGNYELIDVNGQSKRVDTNGFVGNDGYRYFDEIQFCALIESYTNQD